jgi:hypothetical protein
VRGIIEIIKSVVEGLGKKCGPVHVGKRFVVDEGEACCCVWVSWFSLM